MSPVSALVTLCLSLPTLLLLVVQRAWLQTASGPIRMSEEGSWQYGLSLTDFEVRCPLNRVW